MSGSDVREEGIFWQRVEYAALATGLAGSALACLANYGWHLFRESLFFMCFSAAPFILLGLIGYIARRLMKSNILQPLMAFFASALTILSLTVYIKAVLHPNHSSGMIFVIMPLISLTAVAAVLIGIAVAAVWANPRGDKRE